MKKAIRLVHLSTLVIQSHIDMRPINKLNGRSLESIEMYRSSV